MYPAQSRTRLIITADDFGYSTERNRGIVECFLEGAVTGTTLLINGEAAVEACYLARKHGIPVGLHLNLTEGSPVCKDIHSSLVDANGLLLGKFGFRKALKDGRLKADEVKMEIQAQLSSFEALMQAPPTHVDGHQHVHVLPGVADIFAETIMKSGIAITRLPIQPGLETCKWLTGHKRAFFLQIQQQSKMARSVFKDVGLRYPDCFLGLTTMGEHMTTSHLQDALTTARNEACRRDTSSPLTFELMTHPGYCTLPGSGGCGHGPDEFSQSKDREFEMQVLQTLEWKDILIASDIDLISYKAM